MKKVLAFVLSLCMLLPLVACGNSSSGSTDGSNGDEITAENPTTMVIAHDEILESPLHKGMD